MYKNNICINLHWDGERDGEYEPYEEHVYPLDSTLALRGIPKLDSNNKLYFDGDTYDADGTVTRKYDVVDLGTLTWGIYNNKFVVQLPLSKKYSVNEEVSANKDFRLLRLNGLNKESVLTCNNLFHKM